MEKKRVKISYPERIVHLKAESFSVIKNGITYYQEETQERALISIQGSWGFGGGHTKGLANYGKKYAKKNTIEERKVTSLIFREKK